MTSYLEICFKKHINLCLTSRLGISKKTTNIKIIYMEIERGEKESVCVCVCVREREREREREIERERERE